MFMLQEELSKKIDEKLKEYKFLMHTNFLTTATTSLFYYFKLFTLMNMWIIGKNFIKKNYNEGSDERIFSWSWISWKIHDLHNDVPFSRTTYQKVVKIVANLHDKTESVIHIRHLKQKLDYGLFLKKSS